jgi:hypothetical protein
MRALLVAFHGFNSLWCWQAAGTKLAETFVLAHEYPDKT